MSKLRANGAKNQASPGSNVVVPWETVDHRGQWILGDSGLWGTVDPEGQWILGGSGPWRTVDPGGQWTLEDSGNDFACPEVYFSLLCTEFSLLALQCIL